MKCKERFASPRPLSELATLKVEYHGSQLSDQRVVPVFTLSSQAQKTYNVRLSLPI